jgi:hypothetical protein
MPIKVYRGPSATDIVGTWLAPPDESVSILVYTDKEDQLGGES